MDNYSGSCVASLLYSLKKNIIMLLEIFDSSFPFDRFACGGSIMDHNMACGTHGVVLYRRPDR